LEGNLPYIESIIKEKTNKDWTSMMVNSIKKYFSGLSKNTFLLAMSSLFSDIATEMLYPILPYMEQYLQSLEVFCWHG
jgi:hypothetical protein